MNQDNTTSEDSFFNKLREILENFGEPLFSIGRTPITLVSVLTCLAFIVFAFILSAVLRGVLTKVYNRRKIEEGLQHTLNRLLHYFIIGVGFFLAIDNLGVSLTALAAVGGVLLVGIGFGLQDLAKNFISGIIILLERPIRRGDFIEVNGNQGTVKEIGLRATVINTYDDIEILIPNGKLINDVVVNRLYKKRHYRIRINIGVSYDSDPEQVRDILINIAKAHPNILEKPVPIVFFENFKDSYLDFRLMGWLSNARLEPRVKSDLHFEVNKAFKKADIEIAYPQLDLHLRDGWKEIKNNLGSNPSS